MGYQHIINLYRPEGQLILLMREAWALEKVDGTSAHITVDCSFHPAARRPAHSRSALATAMANQLGPSLGSRSFASDQVICGQRRVHRRWRDVPIPRSVREILHLRAHIGRRS